MSEPVADEVAAGSFYYPGGDWPAGGQGLAALALNGNRTDFTTTVDDIEAPGVTAADAYQLGTALCEEVRGAEAFLPPADLALWDEAMSNFYQASILIHARKSALSYLQAGTADMNMFLAAARASAS